MQTDPKILIDGVSVTAAVKRSRSLFWGKNSTAIEVAINSPGGKLPVSSLGESLAISLEPFLSGSGQPSGSAENLRGAERSSSQPSIGPAGERLFFASGEVQSSPDVNTMRSSGYSGRESLGNERLWFALTTGFDRSDGKSIWYRVSSHAASDLRPYLPRLTPRLFTRMLPVVIDQLQIGFDLFGTKIQSSLFGSGPVVYGKVRIDLAPASCRLVIEEHFARGESGMPLSERQVPQLIDRALAAAGVLQGFVPYLTAAVEQPQGR